MLYILNSYVPLRVLKEVSYSGINYRSSAIGTISKIKEYYETEGARFKDIEINFKMRVNSIYDYNNVFQTAPWNQGICLELVSPSSLGLVVSDKTSGGFFGYRLTDILELHKWYKVRIKIDCKKI